MSTEETTAPGDDVLRKLVAEQQIEIERLAVQLTVVAEERNVLASDRRTYAEAIEANAEQAETIRGLVEKVRGLEVETIDIVFDGPPSHDAGRFVETEDAEGKGIGLGEWVERDDGYWALRFPVAVSILRRALARSRSEPAAPGAESDKCQCGHTFIEHHRGAQGSGDFRCHGDECECILFAPSAKPISKMSPAEKLWNHPDDSDAPDPSAEPEGGVTTFLDGAPISAHPAEREGNDDE